MADEEGDGRGCVGIIAILLISVGAGWAWGGQGLLVVGALLFLVVFVDRS